jgi:hypothetical protein
MVDVTSVLNNSSSLITHALTRMQLTLMPLDGCMHDGALTPNSPQLLTRQMLQ